MSGSINGDAAVEMKVTKAAKDSEYQSIVALVKSSEAKPAKFVKWLIATLYHSLLFL